jgi:hypothetical protein
MQKPLEMLLEHKDRRRENREWQPRRLRHLAITCGVTKLNRQDEQDDRRADGEGERQVRQVAVPALCKLVRPLGRILRHKAVREGMPKLRTH